MRAKQQPTTNADVSATSSTHCFAFQPKTEPGTVEQQLSVDSLEDGGTEPHAGDVSGLGLLTDAVNTTGSTVAKTRMKNLSAASRRKRAKPHRLSTGTVHDRTEQQDTMSHDADNIDAGDAVDLRAATSDVCTADDHASTGGNWVEAERERNIERLQRNLEQEPAVDWEFWRPRDLHMHYMQGDHPTHWENLVKSGN